MAEPIDLTGRHIKNFYIEGYVGNFGKGRLWLCRCVCGKELILPTRKLSENTRPRSCGCIRTPRLPVGEAAQRELERRYKQEAEKRSISYSLTTEEFRSLICMDCYYCGTQPSKAKKTKDSLGYFFYNGIDRRDNTQGYINWNCVPCCKECNVAKNDMDVARFIYLCNQVAARHPWKLRVG